MRPLSDILQKLPTTAETGLTPESVQTSRKQFGENRLTPLPREPLWKKFLEKFDEPIIKILLAAALLSMFVDVFRADVTAAAVSLGVTPGPLRARSSVVPTEITPPAVLPDALSLAVGARVTSALATNAPRVLTWLAPRRETVPAMPAGLCSVVAVIPRKFPKDQAAQGGAPTGQTLDPASQGDEAETNKKD